MAMEFWILCEKLFKKHATTCIWANSCNASNKDILPSSDTVNKQNITAILQMPLFHILCIKELDESILNSKRFLEMLRKDNWCCSFETEWNTFKALNDLKCRPKERIPCDFDQICVFLVLLSAHRRKKSPEQKQTLNRSEQYSINSWRLNTVWPAGRHLRS